ncbi:metabolism of cobalamin associated Db isoform X2 [Cynoglossus semilaevis]|uniref:Metabolism of cobalamin associated D n=2 Tax=Cynoglossus semilaevis TaxID=244447 RepID=A0A3P8WI36_CYNSE|nr:methylmalonic aciduria and homocystinuria type D protein, mitochondrial isoform X2 [Cynoglossus semilaevis]
MAGVRQVLCRRAQLVTYIPALHVLVNRVTGARTFAATILSGCEKPSRGPSPDTEPKKAESSENLDFLGLQDSRFLLPGNLGFDCHLEGLTMQQQQQQQQKKKTTGPEGLLCPSSGDKKELTLTEDGSDQADPQNMSRSDQCFDDSTVECSIQPCPQQLQKDFQMMFPDAPPSALTVVTVTQRTVNDMTAWSPEVEQEREVLLSKFVGGAQQICSALQSEGFWADFIEPSCGLPFFGPYTNNTLFETDERYRHLGFQIEDLGCCRVIGHRLWGTHVFVGTIVTEAPPTSSVMKRLQGS